MSKTTVIVNESILKGATLPMQTETYTVISHGFIIDHVKKGLEERGFAILAEEYRANNNYEVAKGSYVVQHSDDPEMRMMFSWVNSYDKSTKFQCGVGASVIANQSYILAEDMTNWIRKHTGTADTEAENIMNDQLDSAENYFKMLVSDKNQMKDIMVIPQTYYAILGKLYFTNAISTQQLSAIKGEYLNPSYVYTTDEHSLWTLYNHILVVLKSAHPKNWMKQQTHVHYVLKNEFGLQSMQFDDEEIEEEIDDEVIDPLYAFPNQTNILDQIAEMESTLMKDDDVWPEVEEVTDGIYVPVQEPDVVEYTDPAGNTFEAPIVVDNFITDEEEDAIMEQILVPVAPERVKFSVDNTEIVEEEIIEEVTEENLLELHLEELEEEGVEVDNSLDFDFNPVVEEVEEEVPVEEELVEETPEAEAEVPVEVPAEDPYIRGIISNELDELFGEEKDFTYKLSGDQYVITFEDNTTVELDKEYIDLLS